MQVDRTKAAARWAGADGLTDAALASALGEMERGLIDAHLGGQVVKKRVALPGRGKRGGARTLLAKELLNYPAASLTKSIKAGELIEVEVDDGGN